MNKLSPDSLGSNEKVLDLNLGSERLVLLMKELQTAPKAGAEDVRTEAVVWSEISEELIRVATQIRTAVIEPMSRVMDVALDTNPPSDDAQRVLLTALLTWFEKVREDIDLSQTTVEAEAQAATAEVAAVVELPDSAFEGGSKSEPLPDDSDEGEDRSAGTEAVKEDYMGHRDEFESLLANANKKNLKSALKKKARQMVEVQGIKTDDVVAVIHSLSDGGENGNGRILGEIIVFVYTQLATDQGQQAIRNFIEKQYNLKNLRGPIKNHIAKIKVRGAKKGADEFPFAHILSEHLQGDAADAVRAKSVAHSPDKPIDSRVCRVRRVR